MLRPLMVACAAVVLSLACLVSSAPAQVTGPLGGLPSLESGASLSESNLEAALRALDPDLKVRKCFDDKDKPVATLYGLSVSIGNDKHRVLIFSSSDPAKNQIDLLVPLTKRLDAKDAAALQGRVDEFNRRSASCKLVWREHQDGTRTLVAQRLIRRPATVQALQTQLDEFLHEVQETRALWSGLRS